MGRGSWNREAQNGPSLLGEGGPSNGALEGGLGGVELIRGQSESSSRGRSAGVCL